MPRLEHTVTAQHRLTPTERALVRLVRELVNDVRLAGGMAPLTMPELDHRLWDIIRHTIREDRS
jgi:hypothetical protein